jgi:hypothetical protein
VEFIAINGNKILTPYFSTDPSTVIKILQKQPFLTGLLEALCLIEPERRMSPSRAKLRSGTSLYSGNLKAKFNRKIHKICNSLVSQVVITLLSLRKYRGPRANDR